MPTNSVDPWKMASVDELLALAAVMEQEAIDGYVALSLRMKEMGRSDLATVFDALVAEEEGHLGKVDQWRDELGHGGPALASPRLPDKLFDDEGTGKATPDLLSAYRAFSLAVRNEERAFVFWSYVSAHAQSEEIRTAAERMAREELRHVATLRRERRKAFHQERAGSLKIAVGDLPALEEKLSRHLRSMGPHQASANESDGLVLFANEAALRAKSTRESPFEGKLSLARATPSAVESPLALCELLADCYLDMGDRAANERDAGRARDFAAQVISCLRALSIQHHQT